MSRKHDLISNTGWMIAQTVFNLVLAIITGPISARYLKPTYYGLVGYSSSIIILFGSVASLGIRSVLINELIVCSDRRGSLIGSALMMRVLSSLLCYAGVILTVVFLEPNNHVLWIITSIQSLTLFFQVSEVLEDWFQLELKMKYVSIASMITKSCITVWQISLLVLHASVYWFALTSSITTLISGIIVFLYFRHLSNIHLSWSWKDSLYLINKSRHYIISGLAVAVYMQIDRVMIGKLLNASEVGIYSVATTLATIWQFIPNSVINSARPVILEKKSENYELYITRFKQTLLLITIICCAAGIMLTLFGKYVILVLYGELYIEAARPLIILCWSSLFSMIGVVRSIWIVGEGLNKYDKFFAVSAAVLNVVLNLFAIRSFGIIGAAYTTLISYAFEVFVATLVFPKTREFNRLFIRSFKEYPALIHLIK